MVRGDHVLSVVYVRTLVRNHGIPWADWWVSYADASVSYGTCMGSGAATAGALVGSCRIEKGKCAFVIFFSRGRYSNQKYCTAYCLEVQM